MNNSQEKRVSELSTNANMSFEIQHNSKSSIFSISKGSKMEISNEKKNKLSFFEGKKCNLGIKQIPSNNNEKLNSEQIDLITFNKKSLILLKDSSINIIKKEKIENESYLKENQLEKHSKQDDEYDKKYPKCIKLPTQYILELKEQKIKEEKATANLKLLDKIPLEIKMIKKITRKRSIRRQSVGAISWEYEAKLKDRFLPQLIKLWKKQILLSYY